MMQNRNFLADIHEGMAVLDAANNEIGKVDWVKISDDNPATVDVEAVSADNPMQREDTLIDNIAEVFRADDLPEEMKERLLQQGFVRMDAHGLFSKDRYIFPDQIAAVGPGSIQLNVSKDDLLKRH